MVSVFCLVWSKAVWSEVVLVKGGLVWSGFGLISFLSKVVLV